MKRTAIVTIRYASTLNVANDISAVVQNSVVFDDVFKFMQQKNRFERLIIFVPFTPPLLNPYLSTFQEFNGEKYFYTTVDGIPRLEIVNQHLLKNIKFIPNSQFSAKNLMSVGLEVDLPVFHGVNFDIVERAKQLVPQLKKKLENDFPNSIKFGIVSGTTKRKNIDLLLQTFDILNKKYSAFDKNIHFFVISHEDFTKNQVPENVHFVSRFGYNPREYVFAFYGAMDYVIVPSGTEGFGLPVLESMAMGTPVIHQTMEPLIEFTSWQWNYLVPVSDIEEYYDKDRGQLWKINRFDPEIMAQTIILASQSQDREERSRNLQELAKKYDIKLLYRRFAEEE